MAHLTLDVLGAMQITLADGETAKFQSDQTRALLVYLAVEADRPHRREALIGLLWPDSPEETARHNLRQALFNLRQTIGDAASDPPYLHITRNEIQFNSASDFALDVASFNALLAACASHPHARLDACAVCARRLQHAVGLYRGKFLQEFFLKDSTAFEEWALTLREGLHQRALDALTSLTTYFEQQGDFGATRRHALRQLELDPWREQAHRQMMRVLALEGQWGAAIAQYDACRRVLAEELDVEPSSETRELYEQISTGRFPQTLREVSSVHTTLATSDVKHPTSDFPIPLTPFIGRDRELAELGRLLADPDCRCVTLVGPGGIGKTRLALQAASMHRHEFSQGAAFVSLVSVDLAEAIIPAITEALGFSLDGPTSPREQLFNHLCDSQMLLVLDNVEQLVNAADMVIALLQHAKGIKLLLTSREPLNILGEWVFDVAGLQIPEDDRTETIESASAVVLFLQRAQRARVGFALREEERPSVARLCHLVDGNPLALELAATWVRTLSVSEIVKEIEHNLGFLSTRVRDLPERHRSIRALFGHSWRLLTKEEQGALLRLSVFRGGFCREAAEDVAGASLSVLSSLVAKSLVRRSGNNRYDMHELILQFAAEQFSAYPEERHKTQARHSDYYLTFFGHADGRLRSSAQREALAELTAEMDNLRIAWDWAVADGEFALIEQTLRAFAMLYDTRGWYREGLDALGRAVDALETVYGPSPDDRANRVALGHLLTTRGLLTYRLGEHKQAQAIFERSLVILRPLDDARVLVEPIAFLGTVMSLTGDYARALELFAEAREKAIAIGDPWFAAICLSLHGHFSRLVGQSGNAHEQLQAAVAEWRAIGDPRFIAFGLNFLGQSALALGRFQEARAALEESVELNVSVGARWNLGNAFQGLAAVAQAEGEHQRAVDTFRKAVDTFTELGGRFYAGQALAEMGKSLFALGNDTEAEHVWRRSLRIAIEIHGTPVALEALLGLASLRAKRGETQSALELVLTVSDHPSSIQDIKSRAEISRAELEARLTPQQREDAQAHMQRRPFESTVEEILKQATHA